MHSRWPMSQKAFFPGAWLTKCTYTISTWYLGSWIPEGQTRLELRQGLPGGVRNACSLLFVCFFPPIWIVSGTRTSLPLRSIPRNIPKSLLLKHGETEAQQQKISSGPSGVQGPLNNYPKMLEGFILSLALFYCSSTCKEKPNKLLKQVNCILNVLFYPCISATELGLP